MASELRGLRRQIPHLMLHGWPKYILAASKPDADACAAPMAFLLAKKLTVDQVWWRKVQAGEKHNPRALEHFIPIIHFDTARKFDGEVVDGKVVKPGNRYFDHHHPDPTLKNHCATSLVIESFGLKDPVLNFLGEYVRRIDTGSPGEATLLLRDGARGGERIVHVNHLHRFFDLYPAKEAFQLIESNVVARALSGLEQLFGTLASTRYVEERQHLELCRKLYAAIIVNDWAYTKTNFLSAKTACEKLVAKLADPDPTADQDLYLAVYGIEKSNAKILSAMSPLVAGLKTDISHGEQLRNGSLAFRSFYNQESQRQKVLRDMMPGGAFKHLYVNHPGGRMVHVVVAPNVPYDGTTMRVEMRHSFHESVDLIICGSPNGQIGLILIDERRQNVLSLRRFRDELLVRHPVYAPSFLHNNEFVLYLKTAKDAKGKLAFDEVVALARELIESTPVVATPKTVTPTAVVATAISV